FQYGYDQDSNRLWRDNLMNSTFGEIYSYDNLGQLNTFARGTLNGNHTGLTGNATANQSWSLDSLGNWNSVTMDNSTETRKHKAQNELITLGNRTMSYDLDGSMTTDENGNHLKYDAWKRLVQVKDSGNVVIASYTYDAQGWRVKQTEAGNTT